MQLLRYIQSIDFLDKTSQYVLRNTLGKLNRWFIRSYDGTNVSNQDIFIKFISKEEGIGADGILANVASFKLHKQTHTQIIYQEVGCVPEVNAFIKKMKEQNNRITGIWVDAHGYSTGFDFTKTRSVKNFDSIDIKGKIREPVGNGNVAELGIGLKKLEEDAVIILDVCQTGRVSARERNASIAQSIATQAPGRRVFAPTDYTSAMNLNLEWLNNRVDVVFLKERRSQRNGILGTISNLYYLAMFFLSFGYYGESMTARFRDTLIAPDLPASRGWYKCILDGQSASPSHPELPAAHKQSDEISQQHEPSQIAQ